MAKRIKASKQKKEAEAEENKISINNIYESREADEVVSINNQLEQETSNESMDEAEMIRPTTKRRKNSNQVQKLLCLTQKTKHLKKLQQKK